MSIMLFAMTGVVLSLSVLYVVASRASAHAALAGENTVIGLHDAGAETLVDGGAGVQRRTEWQLTSVDDLTDAESLLDYLEAQGHVDRELVVLGNSCFAVRWR